MGEIQRSPLPLNFDDFPIKTRKTQLWRFFVFGIGHRVTENTEAGLRRAGENGTERTEGTEGEARKN